MLGPVKEHKLSDPSSVARMHAGELVEIGIYIRNSTSGYPAQTGHYSDACVEVSDYCYIKLIGNRPK